MSLCETRIVTADELSTILGTSIIHDTITNSTLLDPLLHIQLFHVQHFPVKLSRPSSYHTCKPFLIVQSARGCTVTGNFIDVT